MEMIGRVGGYKRIVNVDNPRQTESRDLVGQEARRQVQYRFDFEPPFHCSEQRKDYNCTSQGEEVPIDFGEGGDVRRVSMHFSLIISMLWEVKGLKKTLEISGGPSSQGLKNKYFPGCP